MNVPACIIIVPEGALYCCVLPLFIPYASLEKTISLSNSHNQGALLPFHPSSTFSSFFPRSPSVIPLYSLPLALLTSRPISRSPSVISPIPSSLSSPFAVCFVSSIASSFNFSYPLSLPLFPLFMFSAISCILSLPYHFLSDVVLSPFYPPFFLPFASLCLSLFDPFLFFCVRSLFHQGILLGEFCVFIKVNFDTMNSSLYILVQVKFPV
uniref:Uncharacterized protein n=1 Tax=Cacopsylla melanoneura TaxID=428564 RepID=A0A8D8TYR3_9HEMI